MFINRPYVSSPVRTFANTPDYKIRKETKKMDLSQKQLTQEKSSLERIEEKMKVGFSVLTDLQNLANLVQDHRISDQQLLVFQQEFDKKTAVYHFLTKEMFQTPLLEPGSVQLKKDPGNAVHMIDSALQHHQHQTKEVLSSLEVLKIKTQHHEKTSAQFQQFQNTLDHFEEAKTLSLQTKQRLAALNAADVIYQTQTMNFKAINILLNE